MHDSVTYYFDRVSNYAENGSTPLQEQQDKQPEAVDGVETTIEHDAIDIFTEYCPWSTETFDSCESDEVIYDRNRKEIQRNRKEIQNEVLNDTPVKTEDNKLHIDIIDTYDRNRAQITQSLSDRLDPGQNSLPGAQQVILATKHNDQRIDIPEHLKRIGLSE